MKPKISQFICSLAAALLALAVPFAASAEENPPHPTWSRTPGDVFALTAKDSSGKTLWTIDKCTYDSSIGNLVFNFYREGAGNPKPQQSGLHTLDFYNLAEVFSGKLYIFSNASSQNFNYMDDSDVQEIILPPTLNELSPHVFLGLRALRRVEGLENITKMGSDVFLYDTNLTGDLSLPKLTSIGVRVFADTKVTSVDFSGSSLSTLPDSLFQNCTNLASVTLPSTLTSLGTVVFSNCTSLASVKVEGSDKMFPNQFASMGCDCFADTGALNAFNSAKLTSIPERAFANSGVTGFIAESALTEIGPLAFSNCTSLATIDFTAADNLTTCGEAAFFGCSSLETVTPLLPPKLTSFGASAFEGCSKVAGELQLKGTNYTFAIGASGFGRTFYGWDSVTSLVLGETILDLPPQTFGTDGSPKLATVTFEATAMRELNNNIFPGQTAVTTLNVAAERMRTPNLAFADFTSLTTVDWKGEMPYALTNNPFAASIASDAITVSVHLPGWSRKIWANGYRAPTRVALDPIGSDDIQYGHWILKEAASPSESTYALRQKIENDNPERSSGNGYYEVNTSASGTDTMIIKVDPTWVTAQGKTPDADTTKTWLSEPVKDGSAYTHWMSYVLGMEKTDEEAIISFDPATDDSKDGVTIRLGNVNARSKADTLVSTKFHLMRQEISQDGTTSGWLPDTDSDTPVFTAKYGHCNPSVRFKITTSFVSEGKEIMIDAIDTELPYTGELQTIITPGTDPGGATLTYSLDPNATSGNSDIWTTALTNVGSTNVQIFASKGGYSSAKATAKLTITQAENWWVTSPGMNADQTPAVSWLSENFDAHPRTFVVPDPRFGDESLRAKIGQEGEWQQVTGLTVLNERGIHTVYYNVPETNNYTGLDAQLTYSVDTYYMSETDSGQSSFAKNSSRSGQWTLNPTGKGGTTAAPPTGSTEYPYDYIVLDKGTIRAWAETDLTFGGKSLTLDNGTLAIKNTKSITVEDLIIKGDSSLLTWEDGIGPTAYGNFTLVDDAILKVGTGGNVSDKDLTISAKITGGPDSHIRLHSFDTAWSKSFKLYLKGNLSEFNGVVDCTALALQTNVKFYLTPDTAFAGTIEQLPVAVSGKSLEFHLNAAAVSGGGVKVARANSVVPSTLKLDGTGWPSTANAPILVYPQGTVINAADFKDSTVTGKAPGVICLDDGSVALVINYSSTGTCDVTLTSGEGTYDGETAYTFTVGAKTPSNAELLYSVDDGATWVTVQPSFTEVGNHAVKVYVAAPNYTPAIKDTAVIIDKGSLRWDDVDSKEPVIYPETWKEGLFASTVYMGTTKGGDLVAKLGNDTFVTAEELKAKLATLSGTPGSGTQYDVDFETTNMNYEVLSKEIPITVIAEVPDTPIARPTANNYTYNATERAGVADGEGYTVVNGKKTAVGDYTATVTLATGYCWDSEPAKESLHLPWSIARAAATVTADDKSKKIGDDDPELTATVTGLFGADTVAYTLSRVAGEDIGTYAITPSGNAVQGNYNVSFVPGTFTIKPDIIPVTIKGGSYYEIGSDDDVETVFVFNDTVAGQTFQVDTGCKADLLVVGGGGAGGNGRGGGGGGGGQTVYSEAEVLSAGFYDVAVGAGGAVGALLGTAGGDGGVSAFGTITARGGGGGAGYGVGRSYDSSLVQNGGGNSQNGSTSGQAGNAGGSGGSSGNGGGGGASDAGVGYGWGDGTKPYYGRGGRSYSITGKSETYGSGGGGGYNNATSGNFGRGGAHAGNGGYNADSGDTNGHAADPCFGGGGGGGGSSGATGGAGGSGTVIIRVHGKCDVIRQ